MIIIGASEVDIADLHVFTAEEAEGNQMDFIRAARPERTGRHTVQIFAAGILHPDSLGAVIGFSDYHTRYHFYRAIIEGLCLELYMALRIMEDRSGLTIHEIRIGGVNGTAVNPLPYLPGYVRYGW